MTINLEKAQNARKEILSIASDFLREWDREVDSMQKTISKNKAQSTEELLIEIMATISVRNSFGDRFNLLVQELNQIGQDLISQEYDYRIVMEITEGIDEIFKKSKEFDLELTLSGDLKGYLTDTKFHMSNESVVIQKSWHRKYDSDTDIREIQKERKVIAGDLINQAKEKYNADLKAWEEENKKIEETKETEKCKISEKLNMEKNEKIRQFNNEYTSKSKHVNKKIDKLNKSTEEAKKLLEAAGFFEFSKKIELKKTIKFNETSVETLKQDLISAEQAQKNHIYELNNEYDSKIREEQEKIEGKIIPKVKPRKPKSLCNSSELALRETERRVVSLFIEGGGRFYYMEELKNYIPTDYQRNVVRVVNNLVNEGLVEKLQETPTKVSYIWNYWSDGFAPLNVPYDDL